jgi:hypothetical protein
VHVCMCTAKVTTPEAAEVLAINTLAPFILNSRLRRLLGASLTLNPDPDPIP